MFSLTCVLLLVACLVLTSSSVAIGDLYEHQSGIFDNVYNSALLRRERSPGTIDLAMKSDQSGREASVNINHNLFTSSDGRFAIDAYGQASQNFDNDQSNVSGGIRLPLL